MWSDQAGDSTAVADGRGGGDCSAEGPSTSVHLVVVEPPPDDVQSTCDGHDQYPWGVTYRRLRRASAMM